MVAAAPIIHHIGLFVQQMNSLTPEQTGRDFACHAERSEVSRSWLAERDSSLLLVAQNDTSCRFEAKLRWMVASRQRRWTSQSPTTMASNVAELTAAPIFKEAGS